MSKARLVNVAVPLPVEGALTYLVPEDLPLPEPGIRVRVPVGRRQMVGIVTGDAKEADSKGFKLRKLYGFIDQTPLIPAQLIDFLLWIADYYFYPPGLVFSEALPPGFLSPKDAAISRLIKKGSKPGKSRFTPENLAVSSDIKLTDDQSAAVSSIKKTIFNNSYSPILLHGVTGSGKTEVYLRAASSCLESGRSVLVMVPEIAMTAQTTGWFSSRFGDLLSVLHSGMTVAQRRDQWWRIRTGKSPVVVGTRSAIFSPLDDLGLIIVDEEHDPSYKQSDKLRYNARDMALVLGKRFNATVVLGSATPSLSSYKNAISGKYRLLRLPERITGRSLPAVEIIDRREEEKKLSGAGYKKKSISGKDAWLTPRLETAIKETVERGEQVILFLNRRGFATYIFCRECGYVFRCRNCDITMTWHRALNKKSHASQKALPGASGYLKCHYCGFETVALPACPSCGGTAVKALGFGTEKVEEEIKGRFPYIRSARIDRDTVSSTKRLNSIISDFRSRRLDLIVGTQMITKGHDFPGLTLVGILWADLGLNVPEFNAAERTFQLITQVAGRAGRGNAPGRVLVQTWMADHFAIETASKQDYETFFKKEAALRQELKYAPFARMINFKISGARKAAVMDASAKLAKMARELASGSFKADILGPAPAPRARIKNRYRSQMLIKGTALSQVRGLCSAILEKKDKVVPSSVRVEVDVDPENML